MRSLQKEKTTTVNAGSMADIAFLLLIFFLVTTTILTDKGILMKLPKKNNEKATFNERNIFNISLNSRDEMLVENEFIDFIDLKEKVKEFIDNRGINKKLSDSPDKAIISIKTDRGTTYAFYLNVLNEVKLGYNELRAASLGLNLETYNQLDSKNINDMKQLKNAKETYPMQISDAEPTDSANIN